MSHRKLSDAYLDNTNYGNTKIRENYGSCRPRNGNPFGPTGGFGSPNDPNYGLKSANKWWICETNNNGVRTGKVKVNPSIEVAETCTPITPFNYEGCGYIPPRDSIVSKQMSSCYVSNEDVLGKTYPIVSRQESYIESQTAAGGGKTFEQAKNDAGPLSKLYCTKFEDRNYPGYSCWKDQNGNGGACFMYARNAAQPYSIEQATKERNEEIKRQQVAEREAADRAKIAADGAAFSAGLSKSNLVNIDQKALSSITPQCTVM
jgi:hypothetical protein